MTIISTNQKNFVHGPIGFIYTCQNAGACDFDSMHSWFEQACTGISGAGLAATGRIFKSREDRTLVGAQSICACAGDWVTEHNYRNVKDYSPGHVQLLFDVTQDVPC
jgi:hypothetical protein